MTSNGSAPSWPFIFAAIRSTNCSTIGMCTEGAVPVCRLRSTSSCQYSSIDVSVVCEQSMTTVRSAQSRGSSKLSTWVGCRISSLTQDAVGCFCAPRW